MKRLLLFLLLSASALAAEIPDTPAGRHLADFLRLCDVPDLKAFEEYEGERFANAKPENVARDARTDLSFCSRTGGLRLESIEAGENTVRALAQARATEEWIRIRLDVDPAKGNKLTNFGMAPGEPPESAVPKGLSDAQLAANLEQYAARVAASDRFSGVVVLAKDGKPLLQRAYGMADKEGKRPNALDSIFTIGSMGKMFTATAVAQLVDQGKLSFDDPVGKYLPDYPNQDVREKVTVGMLLTHTSGLGDFLGRRTPAMMQSGVKSAAEYVELFKNDKLRFEPGKGWGYSNAAFALAGAIIEKVTGQSYFDYVRKNVFQRAGMTGCDTNETRAVPAKMVTPYTRREGGMWNERVPAERDIGNPAGGAACSAPDLVRFAAALSSGKLVSKRSWEQLVAPHSETPGGAKYGYGFGIRSRDGRRAVGHGGGFPGVSTSLEIFPEQGYAVVVFGNYDQVAEAVAGRARHLILRQ